MIEKTQTPETELASNNHLADIEDIQNNDPVSAAHRLEAQIRSPQPIVDNEIKGLTSKKLIALSMAAGLALGVGATEAYNVVREKMDFYTVETTDFTINNGGNVINAATEAAKQIFTTRNIDLTAFPNSEIVYESQKAAAELMKTSGNNEIQPGDTFKLEVLSNGLGQYDVHIGSSVPITH